MFGPCNSACTKKRQRFCANADLSVCPRVNANGVEEEVVPCTDEECYGNYPLRSTDIFSKED